MQKPFRKTVYLLLMILAIEARVSDAYADCNDCNRGSPISFANFNLNGVVNGTICKDETVGIYIKTTDTDSCSGGCSTITRSDDTKLDITIRDPLGTVIISLTNVDQNSPGEIWQYSLPADMLGTYEIDVTSDDLCDWANDFPVSQSKTFEVINCCDPCEILCDDTDCNDNGIPDACDVDPNDPDGDGVVSHDCNDNGVPDECEIADGTLPDCDGDGVADECGGACPPVHVVFVMDTSGSMNDEGSALCFSIEQVIEDLQQTHNIAVTSELLGITWARWCLTDTVTNLLGSSVPGNPPPCCTTVNHVEDWGPATATVAALYPWPNGLRVIVPISDEGPNDGNWCCANCNSGDCDTVRSDDLESILHAIQVANDHGVIVSPITGTGYQSCSIDCVEDMAALLASQTEGQWISSTHAANDLPAAIIDIVNAACDAFDDCDGDEIPDACEVDCNENQIPDECEIDADPSLDQNLNDILDECETPPTAVIIVKTAADDQVLSPDGDGIYRIPECTDLKLDGSTSTPNVPGGLSFAWDLDGQSVFDPADAQTPDVLYSNVSDGQAEGLFVIQLQVTNEPGTQAEAEIEIRFQDTEPQASLVGPDEAAPGELVCMEGAVHGPCDPITVLEWDFHYDGTFNPELIGEIPNDLTPCRSWQAPPPGYVVAMRVVDADGSEVILTHPIAIVGSNPPYSSISNDLTLDSKYHVHEEPGGAVIRHRAQLRAVNTGERAADGPIYATFDNLTPSGTMITTAVQGGPLDALGIPYIEMLANGLTLEPGEPTDWIWVEWDIPQGAAEPFGYDSDVFVLQRPPYFVTDFIDTATEGVLYEYGAEAVDPEDLPIYYELGTLLSSPAASANPPDGMSINSTTGLVTWLPSQTADAEEPHIVTIIARDSYAGLHAVQEYTIDVQPVNVAPEIHSIPDTVAVVGQPYEYAIDASDPDNDILTLVNNSYSLFLPPEGASLIDDNGTVKVIMTPTETGFFSINLRVTDGELTTPQDYVLNVVTCLPADRPVILRDSDCVLPGMEDCEKGVEGEPYTKQVELAYEPPDTNVLFFLDVAPEGMLIDEETGLIQWLPSFNSHGTRVVRVRAVSTGDCQDTYAFTIDVEDRNAPPQILTDDLNDATEGVQFIQFIEVTDPDEDHPLEFALNQKPPGMLINSETGQILWTPSQTAAADSPYDVTVIVTDPEGAPDERTYQVNVNEVNVPPDITSLPISVVTEGDLYSYPVTAFDIDNPGDPDGQLLTYSLDFAPPGMEINVGGVKGLIEWPTPLGSSEDSPYFVQVSVSDGVNTVAQPFEVNVYPIPPIPNNPPQIVIPPYPQSFAIVDEDYSYDVVATDVDVDNGEDTLHYRLEDAPASMQIDDWDDPNPGRITMTPNNGDLTPELEPKVYEVRVIVEDERDGWAILTYGLAVYPLGAGNQPPRIISEPVFVAQVNQQYEYVVEAADPDDADLDFDIVPAPENGPDGGPLLAPPSGMDINPHPTDSKKAVITWTPSVDDVGMRWIKVTVTDNNHPEPSYQIYTLTASVVGTNNPPRIDSTPPQSAVVDVEYYYDVEVDDPDPADTHRFELLARPTGATIDEQTGEIRWTPTAAQVGVRNFDVKVTDSGEAWARQYWGVAVNEPGDPCANVPPEITSEPDPDERLIQAGATWSYDVIFDDDNIGDPDCSENLTLTLEQRPSGMNFDDTNPNRIVWTTTDPDDVGTHIVAVRVTDARGAWYQQTFDLHVSNVLGNHGPQITSTPPALAQVGVEYLYEVTVFDENSEDVLTITLEQKPSGASITQIDNNLAEIRWTPDPNQVGPNTFGVRVTDEHGAWQQQNFELTVSLTGQNHPPEISSEPIFVVAQGDLYTYQVDASDPDSGDTLTYSLDLHPDDMTIHPNTGLIQWQTAPDEAVFTHQVKVRVEDQHGAWATQTYSLSVSTDGTNRAPRIISTPSHLVELGQVYTYEMEAVDEDGDTLQWTRPEQPPVGSVNLVVDPDTTTATLTWDTSGMTEAGTHYFRIRVDDLRGGWAEQYFSVTVWEGAPNHPPTFITQPPTHVAEGAVYEYVVEADDIDDDVLEWELTAQPSEGIVTFMPDPANRRATITWDTVGVLEGSYDFKVFVDDLRGGWAEQTFSVVVGPNLPPVITSTPPNHAIVGLTYEYQIEAQDPDDTNLTFVFANGFTPPDDMAIADPSSGLLTWTPTTEGNQPVAIVVRDEATPPNEAVQTFNVQVFTPENGDFASPVVTVNVNPAVVDLDPPASDLVTITITATDDVGIEGNEVDMVIDGPLSNDLIVNGIALTDGSAEYVYQVPVVGGYEVTVTATDISGKIGTASTEFLAQTDATTENTDPLVEIRSPVNYSTDPDIPPTTPQLKGVVPVMGWALDDNFYKYELGYRPVGNTGPFHIFHTGYERVGFFGTPEELGKLDTTQMVNGTYDLLLVAYDLSGNSASYIVTVAVEGAAKVGNFTMSFVDMNIQLGGVPITLTRTYDSRIKTKEDFGVGWEFDLTRMELQESFPIEQGWEVFTGGLGFTCGLAEQLSHTISVRWPDGRLEMFAALPNYQPNQGAPIGGCIGLELYNDPYDGPITFYGAPPGTSSLRLKNPASIPSWIVNFDDGGRMTVDFDPYGGYPTLWISQGYVLTSIDGTEYEFGARDPATGSSRLTRITNRNGQSIVFTENGIFSDDGPGILIQRDAQDRIVKIIDPNQNELNYEYDAAGDLVSFTDRDDNKVQYVYNDEHGLLNIIDPNGNTAARNIYDDHGRLIAMIDAAGNRIEYEHDIDGSVEIIRDRLGHQRTLFYDEDGNVTQDVQTVTLGGNPTTLITRHEYDANGNLKKTILPDDTPGDLTDNPFTERTYDLANNNLLSETDRFGNTTTYTYTSDNQRETVTDPNGNVTRYEYDGFGNQTRIIREVLNGPDEIEVMTYDASGNLETQTDALGNVTQMSYDSLGRLTLQTAADGGVSEFFYDSNGNQHRTVTTRTLPNGEEEQVVSEMIYDESDRLASQINASGVELATDYDFAGRLTAVRTPDGDIVNDYDGLGQLVSTTYPDNSTEVHTYDANGRRTQTTDRDGRVTNYAYDELGRAVKTYMPDDTPAIDHDGPYEETIYNELGEVVERKTVDPSTGTEHRTEFARIDNISTVTNYVTLSEGGPLTPLVTESEYDANGNIIRVTDARGKTTRFTYNHANRRIRTIFHDDTPGDLSDNLYTEVTYDKAGRKIAERDPAGMVTRFEYDEIGRLAKVINALDGETTYTYDELGNRLTQTDAEGRTTTMEYDVLGQLTKRVLPDIQFEETFGTPDAAGRLTEHTDFNNNTIAIEFDVNGRLAKKTLPTVPTITDVIFSYTPGGQRTQAGGSELGIGGDLFAYDDEGRLQRETKENGDFLEYEYDFKGNRTKLTVTTNTDPPVVKVTDYEYDELNRLTKVIDYDGGNPLETVYTYDEVGNRKTLTNPTGVVTEHFYDDLNRLTRVTIKRADGTVLSDYQYTVGPAGNRIGVEEIDHTGQARNVTWEYDALHRLERETIAYPADSSKDRTTTYTYDKVGNRLQMTVETDGCATVVDYDYSDLDRLVHETRTITLAAGKFDDGRHYAINFGDGSQMMASSPPRPPSASPYAKPGLVALASVTLITVFAPLFLLWPRAIGLRSRRRRRRFFSVTVALCMTPCMVIGSKEVRALHHEAVLYRVAQAMPATCDPSVTTITYNYDNNGNMTRREQAADDANVYVYNVENRLERIEHDDGQNPPVPQVEYTYDADGIRKGKTALPGGVVTKYLTDKNRSYAQVLQERDGNDVEQAWYTYGDDLLSQVRGGTRSHYLYDGQLSVRQLTDAPADPVATPPTITDTYTYDAFGVVLESTGSTINHYRYTGEQYDPNAGFYYLRARYYAQDQGRFTTTDPFEGVIQDPTSLHKYLYAHANPVMNIDPSGMFTVVQIAVTSLVVGILAGIITYAITGSVKQAIFIGLLAALIVAAVMVLWTFGPQILAWIKQLLARETAHRTVSNGLFRKMSQNAGQNVAKRNAFFADYSWWRLYLLEWPLGVLQNLLKIFYAPLSFIKWALPTPAAAIFLGAGLLIWLLIKYWNELGSFISDLFAANQAPAANRRRLV
ncbi:MAG: putative Ig domain-containing protein [Phycisphaerales bacterium]|nr:putative Ig domain-containing protein [Phycisphaerales bacterium]